MIFQGIAIAIMLVFYGCYFLKMLSQRRKGVQTDQMGKGKTGLVKWIEITLKAASIAMPLAELICILRNIAALPTVCRMLGALLGLLGDAVFITAVLTMRGSWRAGVSETEKTELVTDGIYRWSRNPAFLGFDLVYIGILLMFFHPLLLLVTLFAVLMFHLQIVNVEEDFLIAVFREEYVSYRGRVNRYFGRRG